MDKNNRRFCEWCWRALVIGVSNQREIIGISKETDIFELKDKISDTISQMCTPQLMYDIYQESIENKVLIVVEVFSGNDTPYFIKSFGKENGTFIRLDATTRNADITTIDELELRGKRRYYDVCHEMNIREPEFLEIGDLLRVNLYRPTYKADTNLIEGCRESALESDELPCKCTVNVPEIALKTYSALKENPRATSAELAELLGIALRTVKNHISILKKCGSIERVGSDKSWYWKITENGES